MKTRPKKPTKPSIAKAKSTPRPSSKKRLLLLLAALGIVLLLSLAFAYHIYQQNTQKTLQQAQAYQAAREKWVKVDDEMKTNYETINASVGNPSYSKAYKDSCSYPSLKFEKGTPTCGTDYVFAYGVGGSSEAAIVMEKVRKVFKDTGAFTFKDSSNPEIIDTSSDRWQSLSVDLKEPNKVQCSLDQEFGALSQISNHEAKESIGTPYYLELTFSCSEGFLKPIFPVVDD